MPTYKKKEVMTIKHVSMPKLHLHIELYHQVDFRAFIYKTQFQFMITQ